MFWPVDWNGSSPKTNPYVKFSLVLMMWSEGRGRNLGGGENFILAEGVKIKFFFGIVRQRKQFGANFCKPFLKFDFNYLNQTFVIQGCPALRLVVTI